jgi:hypothetical protein
MKIAVLCTSRGLIFADTIDSLIENLKGYNWEFISVSGLPIPEAQNEAVKRALKGSSDYFFWVEEDVVIPSGSLKEMIEMDKDVVCVDYPVAGGWSTIKRADGEIKHCGLGCTLMKRKVFEKIPKPWFETDKSLDAKTGRVLDIPMKYGGHDIFFGIKLRNYGFKIHQLEGVECGHLRCPDLNRRESNNGTYQINLLPIISKF